MHVQLSSFVPISAGKAGFPSVAAAVAAAARLFGGAPRRLQLGWTPASEFPDMSLHYPLVRALEGLQSAVHLVAMMHEGQELKSKPQAPRHIKDRFHLHVRPSVTGSYYQEVLLTPQSGISALDFGEEAQVKNTLEDALGAIEQGDLEKFQSTIPNPEFQRPLIASFKRTLSDSSKNCRIKIENGNGAVITDSDSVSKKFDIFKTLRSDPNMESFATGYVEKIDFYKRILFIRIPHTGNLLQCHYKKKVEGTLIKKKVQVSSNRRKNRG